MINTKLCQTDRPITHVFVIKNPLISVYTVDIALVIQASHKSSLMEVHSYNNTISLNLPHYQCQYIKNTVKYNATQSVRWQYVTEN